MEPSLGHKGVLSFAEQATTLSFLHSFSFPVLPPSLSCRVSLEDHLLNKSHDFESVSGSVLGNPTQDQCMCLTTWPHSIDTDFSSTIFILLLMKNSAPGLLCPYPSPYLYQWESENHLFEAKILEMITLK